jgi:SAM-dependent methyltransferase
MDLETATQQTLQWYNEASASFEEGTKNHDVSQNYAALLEAIDVPPPFQLLDLGCGPGRDLLYFKSQGHNVIGLDGSEQFVARAKVISGCEVLHQNFMDLCLPENRFDGIFANASLFHVPTSALPRVLKQVYASLKSGGILFSSNPRGNDTEDFYGGRHGAFHSLETWRAYLTAAGFAELRHYYRPEGKPRPEQPWLATVWRATKPADEDRSATG